MSSKKPKVKRTKGTTLNELADGTTLLPGRRECCCEASRHALVGNCLSCGRIVCAQEGSGDCFTCGQLVLTSSERQMIIADKNKQMSNNGHKPGNARKPMNNSLNSGLKDIAASFETDTGLTGLEKAIEHKDKLLEFDRNSSVRTKVIDDENDYFALSSQNYITNQNRKNIASKVDELHQNKLKTNKKILIDLIQHSATDYSEPVIKDFEQQIQQLHTDSQLKSDYQTVDASLLIDQKSPSKVMDLVYLNPKQNTTQRTAEDLNVTQRLIKSYSKFRLQDKELMEICDEGMCLSIGQPFASLLVSGIKRYEGRHWYSPFRGRLWIHSNNKKPNEDFVQKIENLYRFGGVKSFPSTYPLSALVGCVTVTDCLPIDEYRQKYMETEAEDNYIFVCEDPKHLMDPLPVATGGHRIYKLNPAFHLMAKKFIEL